MVPYLSSTIPLCCHMQLRRCRTFSFERAIYLFAGADFSSPLPDAGQSLQSESAS